jgi:hypothetical protein
MNDKISINEKKLLACLECPLRGNDTRIQEPSVLFCAEETARWLMKEQLAGRAPGIKEACDVWEAAWATTANCQSKDIIPQQEYNRILRGGIRACRRLSDLVWRCEVLQLVSPYALSIGEAVITGEYAVLRSSRKKRHAFALYLRHGGVKSKPLVPDTVSFVRRLDLGNKWQENADWDLDSIGVMHYWLSGDHSAEHRPGRSFANDVVLGAVGVITGNPYPIPGKHCLDCPSRACRPDESKVQHFSR